VLEITANGIIEEATSDFLIRIIITVVFQDLPLLMFLNE